MRDSYYPSQCRNLNYATVLAEVIDPLTLYIDDSDSDDSIYGKKSKRIRIDTSRHVPIDDLMDSNIDN